MRNIRSNNRKITVVKPLEIIEAEPKTITDRHTNNIYPQDNISAPTYDEVSTLVKLDSANDYEGINFCKICGNAFLHFDEIRALPFGHPYHNKCLLDKVTKKR